MTIFVSLNKDFTLDSSNSKDDKKISARTIWFIYAHSGLSHSMMRITLLFFVIVFLLIPVVSARAATPEEARYFVDKVGAQALATINDSSSRKEQKQQRLQQLFSQHVNMEWMGKFVLGRGWQPATQEQRDRYLQAYRNYMLARYTSSFADYTGAKYTITDVKSDEQGQFTVNMQIKAPNQSQDTLAGYRLMASDDGSFKIIDIIIEGVSLITTQRADFSSVLQQQGMEGLIKSIESKSSAEPSSSKS